MYHGEVAKMLKSAFVGGGTRPPYLRPEMRTGVCLIQAWDRVGARREDGVWGVDQQKMRERTSKKWSVQRSGSVRGTESGVSKRE